MDGKKFKTAKRTMLVYYKLVALSCIWFSTKHSQTTHAQPKEPSKVHSSGFSPNLILEKSGT